jgi:hypothetical protein
LQGKEALLHLAASAAQMLYVLVACHVLLNQGSQSTLAVGTAGCGKTQHCDPVHCTVTYLMQLLLWRAAAIASDGLCRWDAAQRLMLRLLLRLYSTAERAVDKGEKAIEAALAAAPGVPPALVAALQAALQNEQLDGQYKVSTNLHFLAVYCYVAWVQI